jgi:hypothetical protein
MTDEVQSDIGALAHAIEHGAQPVKVIGGDLRLALAEGNRRDQVGELDGPDLWLDDLAPLHPVPLVGGENGRIEQPGPDRFVDRKLLFGGCTEADRLTDSGLRPAGRKRRCRGDRSFDTGRKDGA